MARRLIGVCVPAKLAALTVQRGRYLMQWESARRCSEHRAGQHWDDGGDWGDGVHRGGLAC